MALTKAEKERVNDSMLKIKSVAKSLRKLNPKDIPEYHDIESCLEDTGRSLQSALESPDEDA